jgi:hypothetical protein
MAGAPIVGGNNTKAGICQQWDNVTPLPPGLRKSVKEYDSSLSLTVSHIVKSHAGFDVSDGMAADLNSRSFDSHLRGPFLGAGFVGAARLSLNVRDISSAGKRR